MNKQYQAVEAGRNYVQIPLLADELLAEARRHARLRKRPHGYEMRVLDDGSVFFCNTDDAGFNRLISFAEIAEASRRDFRLHPRRSLWKHVLEMWL